MSHGWQKVWWRMCARFWWRRYLLRKNRAHCYEDFRAAATCRRRAEKFFRRVKGAPS